MCGQYNVADWKCPQRSDDNGLLSQVILVCGAEFQRSSVTQPQPVDSYLVPNDHRVAKIRSPTKQPIGATPFIAGPSSASA